MDKELRLGNLVYGIANKPFKVAKLSTPQFEKWNSGEDFNIILEDLQKKDYYMECGVNPIPLTVEWLLRFGFNKDYKKGYIGIDVHNTDFVLTEPNTLGDWQNTYIFQFTSGNVPKFTELQYVHQLQNLFFALSGSELNLVNQ